MLIALLIVAAAALASMAEAEEAPSRSRLSFEALQAARSTPTSASGKGICPASLKVGDLPFRDTGNTCDAIDTVNSYAGACTLQGVDYPGPDRVYAITLTEGNSVRFSLDLTDSAGDLALVLIGECGDGTSCVTNSPDLIGSGMGPEELQVASYPAGTYALYVDSALAPGEPGSCGAYSLSITGRNSPEADLSIRQTAAPEPVSAGSLLTYTLAVTNESPFDATGVVATASLPTGVRLVSSSALCNLNGMNTMVCEIGDLAAFGSVAPEVTVVVGASVRGTLASTSEVTGLEDDPELSNNTSTRVSNLVGRSDFMLSQSDSSDPVLAGTELSYDITVTNAGPSTATDVSLIDTLPTGVSFVSSSDGCRKGAGTRVSCRIGELAVGETATRTLTAMVNPSARGILVSTVEIKARERDPTPSTVSQTTAIRAVADLTVTVTDGQVTTSPGLSISYSIEVKNAGPADVTGARVVDNFPAELIDVTWRCHARGGAGCTGGLMAGNIDDVVTLPVNSSIVYEVSALTPTPFTGMLLNTVEVSTPVDTTDLAFSNNLAVDETTIGGSNLSITKTDSREVDIAISLTFEIIVANLGPEDVVGARVIDDLGGLDALSWTCVPLNGADCFPTDSTSIDDIVNLPVGSSVIYKSVGLLSIGDNIFVGNNTATVELPPGRIDPDFRNNASTDRTTVNGSNLSISTTDGSEAAFSGDDIIYAITATNLGPEDAAGATVTDLFPSGVTTVQWSCAGSDGASCALEGSGNIVDTVDIPANGVVVYTATGIIARAATGTLSNTATIALADDTRDPDHSNNTATDETILVQDETPGTFADLSIAQDDGNEEVIPGQEVTYRIVATNQGPSAAAGATVSSRFPPDLTCNWTCEASDGAACTAGPMSGDINDTVDLPVGGAVAYTADCALVFSASGALATSSRVSTPIGLTDPDLTNNSATDVDVLPPPDLAITKDSGQVAAVAGSPVTYTVTVTNLGPGDATDANVRDIFPAEIVDVNWTCSTSRGATCSPGFGLVNELEPNDSVGAAQTLDPANWSSTFDPDIGDSAANTSTTIPHITVLGTGDRTFDYYSFTVSNAGSLGIFDIDTFDDFDSHLRLFDGAGTLLGANGNSSATDGQGGSLSTLDSYFEFTFPAAGTYVIEVGSCCIGPVTFGGSYRLHLSIEGHPTVGSDINDVVDIPAGGTVTYTISATVAPGATGSVVNTATVRAASGQADPDPSNNRSTDIDLVVSPFDLSIAKDDGQSAVVPGDPLTYVITVTNGGPGSSIGASVSDSFPPELENCDWTCSASPGSACTSSGSGDIDDRIELLSEGTATYEANCTVSAEATGAVINRATVNVGGSLDTDPGNNTATDRNSLPTDLAITKDDGQTVAVAGAPVTYIVTVTNSGTGDVVGATVRDLFPRELRGTSWRCSPSAGATCTAVSDLPAESLFDLVDLPAGGTLTYTINATIAPEATGSLVNTATVAIPEGQRDSDPSNDRATDVDLLVSPSDLAIAKDNGQSVSIPGQPSTYIITVTNDGPGATVGASVFDAFPPELEDCGWTCSASPGSSCTEAGSGDLADRVDLLSGATATYRVACTVSLSATGDVTNTAMVEVSGGFVDLDASNNTASDRDVLPMDLAVTKDNGQETAFAGSPVTYTVTVTNSGPGDVVGATFVDPFPAELEDVNWTCSQSEGASCKDIELVDEVEPNDTAATAQDLDQANWSLAFDPNVGDASSNTSTTIPHVTVLGTGDGTFDYYSFSVANGGERGIFDLDFSTRLDSHLRLYDSAGVLLASIDDSPSSLGQGGSRTSLDSYIQFVFPSAGIYVIEVGSCCIGPVTPGGAYQLQISLESQLIARGDINEVIDVPAGGEVTYTVFATIARGATGALVNTATVTAPAGQPDLDPSNNSATDTDTLMPKVSDATRLGTGGLRASGEDSATTPPADPRTPTDGQPTASGSLAPAEIPTIGWLGVVVLTALLGLASLDLLRRR